MINAYQPSTNDDSITINQEVDGLGVYQSKLYQIILAHLVSTMIVAGLPIGKGW